MVKVILIKFFINHLMFRCLNPTFSKINQVIYTGLKQALWKRDFHFCFNLLEHEFLYAIFDCHQWGLYV